MRKAKTLVVEPEVAVARMEMAEQFIVGIPTKNFSLNHCGAYRMKHQVGYESLKDPKMVACLGGWISAMPEFRAWEVVMYGHGRNPLMAIRPCSSVVLERVALWLGLVMHETDIFWGFEAPKKFHMEEALRRLAVQVAKKRELLVLETKPEMEVCV